MALSSKSREKLNEWIMWHNFHADKVGTYPVQGQIAWLLKAVSGAYHCIAEVARENDADELRRLGLERTVGGVLLPSTRWTR